MCKEDRSGENPVTTEGGDRMRAKMSRVKYLLFSTAALATLVLAAGARYKPAHFH
jgi:hypothetical protein